MRSTRRNNRISALCVALVYVFFSTFGAVAHSHGYFDPQSTAQAKIGSVKQPASSHHHIVAGQRDCAACEWQALSVTQIAPPAAHVDSALIRMVPTVRSFAIHTVSLSRFSSRAPPVA